MKKSKKKKEESIEDVKQKYPFADEMLTTIRQEYENAGYHMGEQVVYSFETKILPINTRYIEKIISYYFK